MSPSLVAEANPVDQPTIDIKSTDQTSWLGRKMKIFQTSTFRSDLRCCLTVGTVASLAIFIFIITPLTVLFTGVGLTYSENEETVQLAKKLVWGGGFTLAAEGGVVICSVTTWLGCRILGNACNRWQEEARYSV